MNKLNYEEIPLDGILDSPIDLRDYNYREFCCSNLKNNIPDKDEVKYPFDARNQFDTSTCAFQSVTAIVETINDVSDYLSDGFLNAIRSKCDDVGISKGAYTRDVMKIAYKVGAIPKVDFPNLEDYPEIEKSFDKLLNHDELIEKAKDLKCKSYVRVDVEDIPNYIHNEKKPLIFTVRLYESFYKVNHPGTNGMVSFPSTGKRCGNHAMVCVGYKYLDKKLYLKILNSWGEFWSLNGYCWINAADDDLINEVWGFTDLPKRKPGLKYKIGWDKYKTTGKWFYSEDGENLIKEGWKQIQGCWYYFKDSFATDGEWVLDNDSWYFLQSNSCKLLQNEWLLENDKWYRFDNYGKMIKEWYQDTKGQWFYLDLEKGNAYTGWVFIHGKYYYFNENCIMQTGWTKINEEWFYLDQSGAMKTGWLNDNGMWYYLEEQNNGHMGRCYINCSATINDKQYSFDKKGQLIEQNIVSEKCARFIGSWEGFNEKAYVDPYYGESFKYYWTIGYGTCYCSIPEAFPEGLKSTCTKEQALKWLKQEANNCANKLKNDLDNKGVSLTCNEFDALISFAYNCGIQSLLGSTLYNYICNGGRDSLKLKEYFRMWNKANKEYSDGLDRRRISESNLFITGDYSGNV
ncbi:MULTISPECIES: C1 family peptidase [unclassified Clostridium]|uniref:glycoside hydrolase family protein n=1 Tax=unclassified Clostridium TaxID=2614128 RepID=UPI00207985F4|nr:MULTISPECIES: C1 family peptidase [unclassified Clostridium]